MGERRSFRTGSAVRYQRGCFLLSLLRNKRLCFITTASLDLKIDFVGRDLAGVLQVDAATEIQMDGKRNVVAVDFTVLDGLLELVTTHRPDELFALGFQFEGDVVSIAVATRLVTGPGTGRISSQKKGGASDCRHEDASDHARHYMAELSSIERSNKIAINRLPSATSRT